MQTGTAVRLGQGSCPVIPPWKTQSDGPGSRSLSQGPRACAVDADHWQALGGSLQLPRPAFSLLRMTASTAVSTSGQGRPEDGVRAQ